MDPKHLIVGKDYEMIVPHNALALFLREEEGRETNYYYFFSEGTVVCLSEHHISGSIKERQFDENW